MRAATAVGASALFLFALLVLLVEPLRALFLASFWHPVVADALNRPGVALGGGSVAASLSGVAAWVWGGLLAVLLLLLYEPLRRRGIPFDDRSVLVVVPFVAMAPALAVLQDAGWFHGVANLAFVWPILWVLLFSGMAALHAWGARLERLSRHGRLQEPKWAVPAVILLFVAADPILYAAGWLPFAYDPPIWLHALWGLIAIGLWWGATHLGRRATAPSVVFTMGALALGLTAMVVTAWAVGDVRWETEPLSYGGVDGAVPPTSGGEPLFILPSLFAAIATSVAFAAVFGFLKRGRGMQWMSCLTNGASAAVVFAHAWDAWVTWQGAFNPYGLTFGWRAETNPLARWLLELGGFHGLAYVSARLALVCLLLLLLDRVAPQKEAAQTRGLVKLALLLLAGAPATQDALSIAMGV